MAQGLTFTNTGKAVLGSVEPGWSQQEFATPVNPNEKAGGTGVVSFTAEDVAAGVLAINKSAVSTVEGLGSVSGTVRTASKTGQRVTVTHDNKLARYNAIRNMPPMISASVPGCLDLAEQMLGTVLFNRTTGAYWSLAGHQTGFDAQGRIVEAETVFRGPVQTAGIPGASETFRTSSTYKRINATGFSVVGGNIYATELLGPDIAPMQNPATATRVRMSCKIMLNGGNWTMDLEGGPFDSNLGYGFGYPLRITVSHSANTISFSGDAMVGGVLTAISGSTSIASLDRNAELALFMDWGNGTGRAQMNIRICNTSNYSSFQTLLVDTQTFSPEAYPWTITGNTRAFWIDEDVLGGFQTPSEWEAARPYTASSLSVVGEPSIGFTGSVWDWLQNACSAYRWEIGLDADVVVARPVGTKTLSFDNTAPSPTLTPTTTRTGRSVDIVWQNGSVVSDAEVYNARQDDNRIISVQPAQESVIKIQTGAYLTAVSQPRRITGSAFLIGISNYYEIVDSTGLPIVAGQWEDYGGALSVEIDDAEAGAVNVTLNGPREEIPSTTAPYSVAVSDGENQYAALSIVGSGVVANPQTLNLLTGANPDITPQEIAFTVNNPFIDTLEQAYDAGIWASVDAAGPRVSLDASVPTETLTGFGDTAGSLVDAFDSTYRVASASVGRTATSVEAVRHATVGAFDDAWAGSDVSDHDVAWDGYLCEDQDVFPYLGSPAATLPPPVFPP